MNHEIDAALMLVDVCKQGALTEARFDPLAFQPWHGPLEVPVLCPVTRR